MPLADGNKVIMGMQVKSHEEQTRTWIHICAPSQQQMDPTNPTHDFLNRRDPTQPKFDSTIRYTLQISTNINMITIYSPKNWHSKTKQHKSLLSSVTIRYRPAFEIVTPPATSWTYEVYALIKFSSGFSPPPQKLTFGSRAFRFSAPRVCNSLLFSIRETKSLPTFRRHLKTFYF